MTEFTDNRPDDSQNDSSQQFLPETTGRNAVDAAQAEAQAVLELGSMAEHMASSERRRTELDLVRDQLSRLSQSENATLSNYLQIHGIPLISTQYAGYRSEMANEFFRHGGGQVTDFPDLSWPRWLGTVASDDQLTNFLQWHVHSLAEQTQSPEVETAIADERKTYKAAIQQAIADGWLSPDAVSAIKKVDDIKVYIGDLFDTYTKGMGGYHRTGADFVVIGQGIGRSNEKQLASLKVNIDQVLPHEDNHAVLGELGDEWLNEALTEHIALSLKFGDHRVVDPNERPNDDRLGAYVARRVLLATVLSGGTKQVSAELATRLYSQHGDEKLWSPNQLQDELDESWGVYGLIHDISSHVWHLEQKYIGAGMDRMGAQEAAAHEARSDLLQQPQIIFFDEYERPDKVA